MNVDVKPGIYTTEFWSKNVVQLVTYGLALWIAFGHPLSPQEQGAIIGIATVVVAMLEGLYAILRTDTKTTAMQVNAAPPVAAQPDSKPVVAKAPAKAAAKP